jgi:hypothetical protein
MLYIALCIDMCCVVLAPHVINVTTISLDFIPMLPAQCWKSEHSWPDCQHPYNCTECPKKMYTHKVSIPYDNVYTYFWDTLHITLSVSSNYQYHCRMHCDVEVLVLNLLNSHCTCMTLICFTYQITHTLPSV